MKVKRFVAAIETVYTCRPAVQISSCAPLGKQGCGGCDLHGEVLTPPAKPQHSSCPDVTRPPRRPPALRSPRASQEPWRPPQSAVQSGNHLPAPITLMHAMLLVRHSHPTAVDGCQPRSVIHLASGKRREKRKKLQAVSFLYLEPRGQSHKSNKRQ